MLFPLIRRPHDFELTDAEGLREALMDRIRNEIRLAGQPQPLLILLRPRYEDQFDLDRLSRADANLDAGATWKKLRGEHEVLRTFAVFSVARDDQDEAVERAAMLFEIIKGKPERYWMAILPYSVDTEKGVARVDAPWEQSEGDTADASLLWPMLQALVDPPATAIAAKVGPPTAPEPEIHAAFGELPENVPPIDSPLRIAELTGTLAAKDLVEGQINGAVAVRLVGRSWEMFVFGDDQPAPIDDMVRYIANKREPVAEAVALVQIVLADSPKGQIPTIEIIGEHGGERIWSRAPIVISPTGRRQLASISWSAVVPVDGDGWLGVDPLVEFDLGPLGAAEA